MDQIVFQPDRAGEHWRSGRNVGDGTASRNVALDLTNKAPVLVLVVPTNASHRVYRVVGDTAGRSTANGVAINNSVTALSNNQVTIGTALNTVGVTYDVWAITPDSSARSSREDIMRTMPTHHVVPAGVRLLLLLLAAAVLWPSTARAQADEVVYYHTDAIGSVRMTTDASGAVIDRYDFLPFGEAWAPPTNPDQRQFAGKSRDTETGLDYFGARYYASQTGRFTTVDPVLNIEAAVTDPQRWNRYVYTGSNPLRRIDPDGRDWWDFAKGTGRGVVDTITAPLSWRRLSQQTRQRRGRQYSRMLACSCTAWRIRRR